MLYLLTAVLAQPAAQPAPALSRTTDCRPTLILMSGGREPATRRPRPCMTMASIRKG